MSRLLDYVKKFGPRTYPSTHKRCHGCGEVIPWEDDCSHGHFKEIGRQIRAKAIKQSAWTRREK